MNKDAVKPTESPKAQIESEQPKEEEISIEAAKKMLAENKDIEIRDDVSDSSFNPSDISEDEDVVSGSEDSSSGEEEDFVRPKEVQYGGVKLYKLEYKEDIEKQKKRQLELEEESQEEEQEEGAEGDAEKTEQSSFMEYREQLTDEEIEKYKSDEDCDFNPMCETMSDHDYELDNSQDEDKEDESEPEMETIDSKHKKTGEQLLRLKIQELKIPPPSGCGAATESPQRATDAAMEVV